VNPLGWGYPTPRNRLEAARGAGIQQGIFLQRKEIERGWLLTRPAACSAALTSAATAPGSAIRLPRLVNFDSASLEVRAVERLNSLRSFIGVGHFDETEAPRLTGELVCHYDRTFDLSRLSK
jgi:hypothetical protein